MWSRMGWCGVVCHGVFLLQDWAHPACMNFVQAATMLCSVCSFYPLALQALHVAHPPPSVRLLVSGRALVASREAKSFELVRSLVGCMG